MRISDGSSDVCSSDLAQGESAPKARAKAVVDGNQVNIPGPAGGDEWRKLCGLIGLSVPRSCSRKQPPLIDRTRNRHRWTGRAYQGACENDAAGTRQITPVTSGARGPLPGQPGGGGQ